MSWVWRFVVGSGPEGWSPYDAPHGTAPPVTGSLWHPPLPMTRTSWEAAVALHTVGKLPPLQPPPERVEVARRLTARAAPVPLLADRRRESQFEDRVEGFVGVRQHRAEQPVDLLRRDRRQRQSAVEVDVPGVIDREGD